MENRPPNRYWVLFLIIAILAISLIFLSFSLHNYSIHGGDKSDVEDSVNNQDLLTIINTDIEKNTESDQVEGKSHKTIQNILTCADRPNSAGPQVVIQLDELSSKLSSIEPDRGAFLKAYRLLGADMSSSFELFKTISDNPEFSELARFNLLKICSIEWIDGCSNQVIDNALEAHSTNSSAWLMVASTHAAKNNVQEFKRTAQEALAAPEYRQSFPQEAQLIKESIFMVESISENDMYFNLMGYHAAQVIQGYDYMKLCTELAPEDAELAQICLDIANLKINKGPEDMDVLLGHNLAIRTHKSLGEFDESQKYEESKSEYSSISNDTNFDSAFSLAMSDTSLFSFWLEQILNYSEREAKVRFIEEAKRRTSDPDYNPCKRLNEVSE